MARICRTVLAAASILIGTQVLQAARLLYVSDVDSDSILTFTPDGTQSTFASGLNDPAGLAFDASGNLFVADAGSGNIYKFTPDGVRSTFASGLGLPTGLAFDAVGNLFESDAGSGTIFKFAPDGMKTPFASNLVPGSVGPASPSGLAFDESGNLFAGVIVPTIKFPVGAVLKFTPDGTKSTFAFAGPGVPLVIPTGLAFDPSGNLLVGDVSFLCCGNGGILEFTPAGAPSIFEMGLDPYGLAFDSNGNLFVSDYGTGSILKFTPDGASSPFASVSRPSYLAFGPDVPEPRSFVLVLIGAACVGFFARNRN